MELSYLLDHVDHVILIKQRLQGDAKRAELNQGDFNAFKKQMVETKGTMVLTVLIHCSESVRIEDKCRVSPKTALF